MECWDLLDDKGNLTGNTMVRGAYMRAGQYHLVVHIWVVDSNGRILLQRRALNRRLMPGAWAATGGSAVDAVNFIKERGVKNIKFICIIAAPEGVKRLMSVHPDVKLYVGCLDRELNENAYILPGLGDAGDRIFGTK